MALVQIGRQNAFFGLRIAPHEGLPGKVIVAEQEVAAQLFEAMAQDGRNRAVVGQRGEFVILLWRDAQAEERALATGQPTDQRLVKERCDAAVEKHALFAQRSGLCQLFQTHAMAAGDQVANGDETAEQAGAVDVAVEDGDATASAQASCFPIASCRRVEIGCDMAIVHAAVGCHELFAEQAADRGVIRQVAKGRKLEPVERHMVRIEIDHIDRGRTSAQIGQHVAAARADCDDAGPFVQIHGLHVDVRIFPDLGVDEPREEKADESLGKARRRQGRMLQQGVLQLLVSTKSGIWCNVCHVDPPSFAFHGV